jgi:hypothetical protein
MSQYKKHSDRDVVQEAWEDTDREIGSEGRPNLYY